MAKLIGPQIVLVCFGIGWDVLPQDLLFARRESQRQRVDDALGQLVLEPKNIADRCLGGVGTHQRPGCGVRKLRRNADFVACRKQGPGNDHIDVGLRRYRFQILRPRRKLRRGEAGTDH